MSTDLTVQEHQMLEKAAEAGGHFSIRGLSPARMSHAARVARSLHGLRLVTEPRIHKTRQRDADIIDQITVDMTEEGREYLAES